MMERVSGHLSTKWTCPGHETGGMGGLLVRCVRAETPLFTNRIRSQKNSFLSRTGGFFWVGEGGLRKASFALTPFTRLPEVVMCRHGFVRGVKAKPPIFTNRIRSQKNSLLSRTGGFFWVGGGRLQKASFALTHLTSFRAEPTLLSTIWTCPGHRHE